MSQPIDQAYEYPSPVMTSQPASSHSDGSFGPVFAVLAVIVVISAVACVLGRLCSRRRHRAKEAAHGGGATKGSKKQSHGLGPKEWEPKQKPSFNMRDGDIEFGFDSKKSNSSVKGAKNGGGGGKAKPPQHHSNGGRMPEFRFADNV